MDMLLQRFGGGDRANIESQLTDIQQKSSVEDYLADFTRLSYQVTYWTENQLKHVFVSGLKEDIRHDVLALELDSLHHAQNWPKSLKPNFKPNVPLDLIFHAFTQVLTTTHTPSTIFLLEHPQQDPRHSPTHPSNA